MENQNKKSIPKIPFLLLIGVVLFSLSVSAVSAANTSSNSTIYVSTEGNDTWDGLSPTYNTTSGPKKTITNATGTVTTNGTIYIAPGTYNESGITINKDMTITGENQENTIINGQQSGNSIFHILSGITANINNLTLTNGRTPLGGAIYKDGGNLTVTNCTFTNNTAGYGGAIYTNVGSLTVRNCTFTNNTAKQHVGAWGGSIYNYGGNLTVTNCIFTTKTISGLGDDSGGAIYNNGGSLTVINSTFTNNSATRYGGAIFNNGGSLTVTNSTFTNNTAYCGGAIYNKGGSLSMTNCTLTNNTVSEDGGAIYSKDGESFSMTNCTLTNNKAARYGGAIYKDGGRLTVMNCILADNTMNLLQGYGGAIFNNAGSLTVTNSTFADNTAYWYGGAIYNNESLTVTNSTFTNNYAYGDGGAIYNNGSLTVTNSTLKNNTASGDGGAIYNSGGSTVTNSTFTNNNAYTSYGGAIYNHLGGLIVTESTFTNNTAYGDSVAGGDSGAGGAIWSYGGKVVVHFNRIVGNSPNNSQIHSEMGTVNATLNWWGSNLNPSSYVSNGSNGNVDVSSWLILNMTTNPTNISYGGNSTVTVDLLHDNTGTYHDPVNGHVPDGIYVEFSSYLGLYRPADNVLVNGSITSFYIPGTVGSDNIKVTVDNQILSTPVTINQSPTTITVDPVSGAAGQTVTLNTHVTDSNGNPVNEGKVTYKVNGTVIGTVDVSNGLATINWTIPSTWIGGFYGVVVNYLGSHKYLASTTTTNLTVTPIPTAITVDPVNGHAGQTVTITTHVTDSNGNPVNEGKVTYKVNGTVIGTVDVSNGLATINWTIPTTWIGGVYSIVAEYSGNANYLASNNTTNLTVNPTPTNVTLDPVSGFAGQTVTINTHVTDSNSNPVKDGQVTYKVNGTVIGTADVSNGLATINWTIPTTWTTGIYNIIADYSGSSNYLASTNGTSLTLQPSAYLYMNITSSKVNPSVGDKFVLTYKLSNSGPDDAANVVVSFQIPEGLEFVTASVDSGTYTYNPTNRTITWTLNNVKVGDPYLYLTLQALTSGKYTIIPIINSQTHNRNTNTIKPFNINIETPNDNNDPTTNPTTANAASNTITMQKTGTPTTSLILAILAILGGILTPKKK
jgi:predicted outer membrane repeat protein/parallel beta-helix repeat protein